MLDRTDLVLCADAAMDHVDDAMDCVLEDHAIYGEDRIIPIITVAAWMLTGVCEVATRDCKNDEEKLEGVNSIMALVGRRVLESLFNSTLQ